MIEQVPIASSSDDCKTTACGVDARSSMQPTIGMNTLIKNMEQVAKEKKLTGGVGDLRLSTERIVPFCIVID